MTTIIHEQIQALHDAAAAAGDLLQAAICQVAMDGEVDPQTFEVLSDSERAEIVLYDQESATAECKRVILASAREHEPADEDAETDAYTMMMGPDAY